MFGREDKGLPEELLFHNKQHCVRIPTVSYTHLEEALGRITLNGFFDAIYNPRETKLMKMVSDKGVKKVSGGMQMLVWQAAVAHTIWSGAEDTAEQVQAISDEMMRLV